MKRQDPAHIINSLKHFIITLLVAFVVRLGLFLAFVLPLKLHPEYNQGGGFITALFYSGPLIIIDILLLIYFIYVLMSVHKVKKSGNYFEPARKYLRSSIILFTIWVALAVGVTIFIVTLT